MMSFVSRLSAGKRHCVQNLHRFGEGAIVERLALPDYLGISRNAPSAAEGISPIPEHSSVSFAVDGNGVYA